MSSTDSDIFEKRLRPLMAAGRIPHALLFSGPGQAEAILAAKHFVSYLFCSAAEKLKPCGACESCRLLEAKTHPDVQWIAPEDSGVIKIETIRGAIRDAALKPYRETRRVCIIKHAETMNEHAQNALLKTLEEPPGPSHFILLAETPELLLATVRSRVQRVYFPFSKSLAVIVESEEAARKEALDYLLGQSDHAPDWVSWDRPAVLRVLESVLGDLRDVLVMTAGAPELSRPEHRSFKERAAREMDAESLVWILEKVAAAKESIRMNSNLKLALPVLWAETRVQAAS